MAPSRRLRTRLLLSVLSVSLPLIGAAGCGPDEPPPPPPPPEPDLPDLGTIDPPDWTEIDPTTPPPVEGGAEEPLAWDFSPGRRHGYLFSQRVSKVVVTRVGEERRVQRARDRTEGRFEFAGGPDGVAQAEIAIRTEESILDGEPLPPAQLQEIPPTQISCLVREDGTATAAKPSLRQAAQFFFGAMLTLREGETNPDHGSVHTRRAGRFRVGRYTCVRLESDFEFRPPTPGGRSVLRGRTVAYFAPQEGRFVRVRTWVSTRMAAKALGRDGRWVLTELRSETTQTLTVR